MLCNPPLSCCARPPCRPQLAHYIVLGHEQFKQAGMADDWASLQLLAHRMDEW